MTEIDLSDATVLYSVSADQIEVGDQIIIEDDLIEVKSVSDTDDIDEVVVKGYSHITGDTETYSLYADDTYDVWGL